jgi:hypothetical protein
MKTRRRAESVRGEGNRERRDEQIARTIVQHVLDMIAPET